MAMTQLPADSAKPANTKTGSNTLPDTYPLISVAELLELTGLRRQGTNPSAQQAPSSVDLSTNAASDPGTDRPEVQILDCRFELANPHKGQQDFDAGHIPGSRYVHIDKDLCAEKTGQNGRHPLPDFFEFVLRTQQWGLKKDSLIIATDAGNAMVAGRLWWMLRWAGYPKAKVLNGGLTAWTQAGGPLAASPADVASPGATPHANWTATEHETPQTASGLTGTDATRQSNADPASSDEPITPAMQTVDVTAVVSNLSQKSFQLIDGRDRERFTGERDTMDPVAGHIPGAKNRCFLDNLNPDGTFKSPVQLKTEYAEMLGDQSPEAIVHSCGSGVTACHNLLAMEAAGLHGSKLYPGSWSEYCADPSRPVERG